MGGRYRLTAIRELARSLAYAPRKLKLQYIDRAERLATELEDDTAYPYAYVAYRVTGFYPSDRGGEPLPAGLLAADLASLVEELSVSAGLELAEAPERIYRLNELASELEVSERTLRRWKQRGLIARRFLWNRRRVLGYLESTVCRFLQRHETLVRRAREFCTLTEDEREAMVRLAKEYKAKNPASKPAEVIRAVAKEMGRAPETVRYNLQEYDEQHPDRAVFENRADRLSWAQKEEIYQAFRHGATVEALAQRFGKTRSTIYRAIQQVRAKRLNEMTIEYMYHPCFDEPGADKVILGPEPTPEKEPKRTKPPKGLPPYLAALYEVPLLSKEEEVYLFRKMNYLKHRAALIQKRLDIQRPRVKDMDEMERLLQEALEVKNRIIRANLRLVVSIAKRHVTPQNNLFELVSDGNMSLIRAVEKFDFSRGFKFSTYASWAIMKNFARSIPEEAVRRDRFVTCYDEIFETAADKKADPYHEATSMREIRQLIHQILSQLDEREQRVIIARFGLDEEGTPRTLEQVGRELGVTKERVRQLESRALRKLQKFAAEHGLEPAQ
jgi:RNA polymerase primary sigma factor